MRDLILGDHQQPPNEIEWIFHADSRIFFCAVDSNSLPSLPYLTPLRVIHHMRSAAVILYSTVATGAYASTLVALRQCVLELGSSSLDALCPSSTLVPFDNYREHQYAEIALHYIDGTKDVISTTGHNPHCAPEALGRHLVYSSRAQDSRPYKATWTRIRYVSSSLSESPCAHGESIISEKVNAISVHSFPSDISASTKAGTTSSGEVPKTAPSERLGPVLPIEDEGYEPMRRRATLGELFQLLLLLMGLGALHYASMQLVARWQAPPPMERRSPQCE
ncbi:unnamed protein product [Rhizoctonia solani]|uniref:Uncharacterized protein n=1 Tax=Rhizoctonia solani TaxID=456999 RepID=A0A8H3CQK9_9AGAM|nr:unnamed protein product [Rhizoctonia solani]